MQYNANPEFRTSGPTDPNCSGTNTDATRNEPLGRPGYRCRDCAAHVGIDDDGPAAIEFVRSSAANHVATGHTVVLVDDAGTHLLTPADIDATTTPDDDHPRCPRCNDVVLAITTCGPTEHHASPCGCRVSDVQVRALRDGHTGTDDQADVDGGIDDEL